MKRIYLQVLLSTLFLLAFSLAAFAQTAESIIENYIKAIGGAEKLAAVKSMVQEGTFDMPAQGLNGSYKRQTKAPDKMRVFIDLGVVQVSQGYDGKIGWAITPQGSGEVTGAQLEQFKMNAGVFPILNYKTSGNKYELLKNEKVGDVEALVVQMTTPGGIVIKTYYDSKSYLPIKSVSPQSEVTISDYKEVEGIKIPYKTVIKNLDQGLEFAITVTSVKFNVEINDSEFAKPAQQ